MTVIELAPHNGHARPAPGLARPPVLQRSPLPGADLVDGLEGHCACGGGCAQCASASGGDTTTIAPADDQFEREADEVAERVVSGDEAGPVHLTYAAAPTRQLERNADMSASKFAPRSVEVALSATGRGLESPVRDSMEAAFGRDLRDVRVHTGTDAGASASAVGALAYTVGRHVVFGDGQYAPATETGRRLLAHELTHVLQQDHAPTRAPLQRQAAAPRPQGEQTPTRRAVEDCSMFIAGNDPCEFYRCRERNQATPCGASGYYLGYGVKYCERFTQLRKRLPPHAQQWVDRARRCLMEYIDAHVPRDIDCATVRRLAFDSHPACYVKAGICSLEPHDWAQIISTIDVRDWEFLQVIITGIDCIGNWMPLAFPVTSLAAGGGYHGLMERDWQRNFGERSRRP